MTDAEDAARWREHVALARAVLDASDAWAEGREAEGEDAAAMRRACRKGRFALDSDDVGGIVLAMLEVGHAERTARGLAIVVATVGRLRRRRRARTRQTRLTARDEEMIAHLETAPRSALCSNRQAARWLLEPHPVKKHSGGVLGERQLVERLKKCGALSRIS